MSTGVTDMVCPKCGYKRAMLEGNSNGERYFFCERCGYGAEEFIDEEKSTFPDNVVWEFSESGGEGFYHYHQKGMGAAEGGPVDKEIIDFMKVNLDKLDLAWYSFQKDEKWFIRDLITNEVRPFPEPEPVGLPW